MGFFNHGRTIGSRARNKARARKRALGVLLVAAAVLVLLDLTLPPRITSRIIARPLIQFYRVGPGRLWTHHCPSRPSCSAYALAAFEKHGLAIGALLTADRLMAEQGRMAEGPWVRVQGRKYVDDPLQANTFWWSP